MHSTVHIEFEGIAALNHVVIGPFLDGSYAAAYETPGCATMTVRCPCRTEQQALEESARLNAQQLRQEAELQCDRALRGMHRIVSDVKVRRVV